MSARRPHAPARPGVIDLRDLQSRYAWEPLHITRFIEAARIEPRGPASVSFTPPHVVVAIVPIDDAEMLHRSRAWLGDAGHLIVVRDGGPELDDGMEEAWRSALESFDAPVDIIDWQSAEDVAEVVERAVAQAALEVPQPPVPVV